MKKPKHITSLIAPSGARWYVDYVFNCPSGMPDTRIVIDIRSGLPRTVDISEVGADFWQEVQDPGDRVDVAAQQFGRVFADLRLWRSKPHEKITSPHLHPENFRTELPEWAVSAPLL
jgi:hypothetical protein